MERNIEAGLAAMQIKIHLKEIFKALQPIAEKEKATDKIDAESDPLTRHIFILSHLAMVMDMNLINFIEAIRIDTKDQEEKEKNDETEI